MHKRRTIPALLTLLKYGEGCENDLTRTSTNLRELIEALKDKMPEGLIQESYSDANKPFSELWNEEGFTFIENPAGATRNGSQKYVLNPSDIDKLFTATKKAERKLPERSNARKIFQSQQGHCNLCGSKVHPLSAIEQSKYAKDRVKMRWDHRVPVEKGGDSVDSNYQLLCFYCNKCKWQICNICNHGSSGCPQCVLAFPERTDVIYPTGERISDRVNRHWIKSDS